MTNKNKFQKFALVLYIIFVIILFVLFSSVLIKTAQRGDSLSSTGDFSRDGVMDYETTEQNDTSEQDTEGSYELIQGVNGQYEYRCTKICSEECGRACEHLYHVHGGDPHCIHDDLPLLRNGRPFKDPFPEKCPGDSQRGDGRRDHGTGTADC